MSTAHAAGTEHVTDPVCGMQVDPATKNHRIEHEGAVHYFCSANCADAFAKDPSRYLMAKEGASSCGQHVHSRAREHAAHETTVATETGYFCPMCPEVPSDKPEAFPKCGMAPEPVVIPPAIRTHDTCPMHPEVVRDAPGKCPICGMAVEPKTVTVVGNALRLRNAQI